MADRKLLFGISMLSLKNKGSSEIIWNSLRENLFGIFNKVIPKPACSTKESSYKTKLLLVGSLDMILSNKGITKALMRRLVFTFVVCKPSRQVFSR